MSKRMADFGIEAKTHSYFETVGFASVSKEALGMDVLVLASPIFFCAQP